MSSPAAPCYNPYEILGVSPDAPEEDINNAWKQCMLHNHPDKNPYGGGISRLLNQARDLVLSGAYKQPPNEPIPQSTCDPSPKPDYDKTHPGKTYKVSLSPNKVVFKFINAWMNDDLECEQPISWIYEKYKAYAIKMGVVPYKTAAMLSRRLALITGVKEHRKKTLRAWKLDHLDAVKDYIGFFIKLDPSRTLKDL